MSVLLAVRFVAVKTCSKRQSRPLLHKNSNVSQWRFCPFVQKNTFLLKIQTKLMQQLKHWTLLIHILSFNHVHIFIFIFHSSAEIFHLQLSRMLFSILLSVSSCLVKCSVLDFSHVRKGTKGRWSQRAEGDVYNLNTHFLRCEASRRRKGELFHRSSLTGSRRTEAGKKDFESCGTFKYTGPHC